MGQANLAPIAGIRAGGTAYIYLWQFYLRWLISADQRSNYDLFYLDHVIWSHQKIPAFPRAFETWFYTKAHVVYKNHYNTLNEIFKKVAPETSSLYK